MSRAPTGNEERRISEYPHQTPITTRWSDNDQYGHLNNSIYYFLFDAIVNTYLIKECGMDPNAGTGPIGLVVGSGCRYHAALSFPDPLVGGMRIVNLGSSSVTYHLAIFKEGQALAGASGWFTHVFVDPLTRRPVPMTKTYRAAFLKLASKDVLEQERKKELAKL